MNNFEVIDFRFAKTSDVYDLLYKQEGAWSRIYEYKYVIDFMSKHINNTESGLAIHNSSWGFEGIHILFRNALNKIGKCIHSDIRKPNSVDEYKYDITTNDKTLVNRFDYVINVSTIEHLDTVENRLSAIENLFNQTVKGGYLILTFDYPRVNLSEIETLVGVKCEKGIEILNGLNSINPNKNYENLNIVYLMLRKNG